MQIDTQNSNWKSKIVQLPHQIKQTPTSHTHNCHWNFKCMQGKSVPFFLVILTYTHRVEILSIYPTKQMVQFMWQIRSLVSLTFSWIHVWRTFQIVFSFFFLSHKWSPKFLWEMKRIWSWFLWYTSRPPLAIVMFLLGVFLGGGQHNYVFSTLLHSYSTFKGAS